MLILNRYSDDLPGVDVFVCTADPTTEPPMMVINTVLSMPAYIYPPEKLSVYLSDDAGSDLTFFALLEGSRFSRYWIPYCNKFRVEHRSPEAHFRSESGTLEADQAQDLSLIKKLYLDIEIKIELAKKLEKVSQNALLEAEDFRSGLLFHPEEIMIPFCKFLLMENMKNLRILKGVGCQHLYIWRVRSDHIIFTTSKLER